MKSLHDLPRHVFRMIESGVVAEFATVTAKGVPIDTPTYYFPADDMSTIDLATGLPNPAKAERARRNAKVGLLIEGRPDEPVVVLRAHAAVRDSDIQANALGYLAETGYKGISHGISWEQARLAVTYWSRIVIENMPERIYWWADHAAPQHPSTYDTKQVLQPSEDTRAKAWARLEYAAARRGQALPIIPDQPPERTRIAKIRMARIESDAPITGITAEHGNRLT